MPYALSCTSSVFQRLINDVPRDTLGRFVIDDLLIYSPLHATFVLSSSPSCRISYTWRGRSASSTNAPSRSWATSSALTACPYTRTGGSHHRLDGQRSATIPGHHHLLPALLQGFQFHSAPTDVTSQVGTQHLAWNPTSEEALNQLKTALTMAHSFHPQTPDPSNPSSSR